MDKRKQNKSNIRSMVQLTEPIFILCKVYYNSMTMHKWKNPLHVKLIFLERKKHLVFMADKYVIQDFS